MTKSSGGLVQKVLHCSFCGKTQHEVIRLIQGPLDTLGKEESVRMTHHPEEDVIKKISSLLPKSNEGKFVMALLMMKISRQKNQVTLEIFLHRSRSWPS